MEDQLSYIQANMNFYSNHDTIIKKILQNNILSKKLRIKKNKYTNIVEYILNRFNDSHSFKESVARIKYGVTIMPKCPICGKNLKYIKVKNDAIEFSKYCSSSCYNSTESRKLAVIKFKNTCLDKYGETTPLKNEKIKNKIKQTCLEKYGVRWASMSKEVKDKSEETCLKKYGVKHIGQSKEIHKKAEQTCLEKYGSTNPWSSSVIKDKIRQTCLEKYGVPHIWCSPDIRKEIAITLKNKYGDEIYWKTKDFKEKFKENNINKFGYDYPMKSNVIQNKYKKTCINKYGEDHPMKSKNISSKMVNTRIMKKNWNSSKEEKDILKYIKNKFPDVKSQYNKDKRYPWYCDFYIPKLDMFIEYNGYWAHGKHPYNENSIEDQNQVNKWLEKYNNGEHPLYKRAIKGWTIRDVEKRNTAKENKLNFYEFWNVNDLIKFIDNL